MAQQANPNVNGHIAPPRAQLINAVLRDINQEVLLCVCEYVYTDFKY